MVRVIHDDDNQADSTARCNLNLGMSTLEWLYHHMLQVDDKWSVKLDDGFRWWPAHFAQTLRYKTVTNSSGETGYIINVQSELYNNYQLSSDHLQLLNMIMTHSSLFGPVYNASDNSIVLSSCVVVHESNAEWIRRLIGFAASQQIDIRMHGGCTSEHPKSGMRNDPDDLVHVAMLMSKINGGNKSAWGYNDFADAANLCKKYSLGIEYTLNDDGLVIKLPCGTNASICHFFAKEVHPRYGNGLLVWQTFPIKAHSLEDGYRMSLELNEDELIDNESTYGLGSYSYRDDYIHFTSFFPNALYMPGLTQLLLYSCITRSQRFGECPVLS